MTTPPPSDVPPHLDAARAAIARDLGEVRAGVLEVLGGISELWLPRMLHGALERPGWTVQHEAAHHAADDAVLAALLEAAAQGIEAWGAPQARRVRGEAMHAVQRLRLAPLRAALEASAEHALLALDTHATLLDRPFALGAAPAASIEALLRAQGERTRAGLEALRATFS